jgi:hypoxanthine phosphoribosyltransferase
MERPTKTKARRRDAAGGEAGPVIVSRARIARRLRELARQIARLYEGRELVIVAGMTGAMVFVADLIRLLPLPLRVHMVGVRSYPGRATRSQGLEFYLPLEACVQSAGRPRPAGKLLRGCHVLVVDDLLDGGGTLAALLDQAAAQSPASLRSCVLFEKLLQGDVTKTGTVLRGRRTVAPRAAAPQNAAPQSPTTQTVAPRPTPDFVGFQIGSEFVVGYGLDFDGRYRNLPDLHLLKRGMAVSAMCNKGVSPVGCRGETPLRRMGKMPMPLGQGPSRRRVQS